MDIEAYRAELRSRIAEHGFTLVGVIDANPCFAYSIGLTQVGWPEVLFIGNLNPVFIEIIMTDLIKSWVEAGKPVMGDNADLIQFADGSSHALRIVEIDSDIAQRDYACQVRQFYPDRPIKIVQVLWPDKAGVYPDEEGYDVRLKQPIISGTMH